MTASTSRMSSAIRERAEAVLAEGSGQKGSGQFGRIIESRAPRARRRLLAMLVSNRKLCYHLGLFGNPSGEESGASI
jgi:hypothetical protein